MTINRLDRLVQYINRNIDDLAGGADYGYVWDSFAADLRAARKQLNRRKAQRRSRTGRR